MDIVVNNGGEELEDIFMAQSNNNQFVLSLNKDENTSTSSKMSRGLKPPATNGGASSTTQNARGSTAVGGK